MSENQDKIKFERTDKGTWSKVVDKDSHNNSIVIVTDDNLIYTLGTHIGASKGNTLNNTIFFKDLNKDEVDVIKTNNIEIKLLVNVNNESIYPIVINVIKIKWQDLVSLRDNGELIPGQLYRIIDYITTTVQENTQSAGHQFDIIVTADSENTLNENARAILHEGDNYFSNSNLSAWELKYSLDNDSTRFGWVNNINEFQNKINIIPILYTLNKEYDIYSPYGLELNYAVPEVISGKLQLKCYLYEDLKSHEDSFDLFEYTGTFNFEDSDVTYDMWMKTSEGLENLYYILTDVITNNKSTDFIWDKILYNKINIIPEYFLSSDDADYKTDYPEDFICIAYSHDVNGTPYLYKRDTELYEDYDQINFLYDNSTIYMWGGKVTYNGEYFDIWVEYAYINELLSWLYTDFRIFTKVIVNNGKISEDLLLKNKYIPNKKGVIYYLKDEFNNECGYDFKNILYTDFKYMSNEAFTGSSGAGSVTLNTDSINSLKNVTLSNSNLLPTWDTTISTFNNWRYTFNNFNGTRDLSLSSSCNNNTIESYDDTPSYPSMLPVIILTSDLIHHNKFENCSGKIYVLSSSGINHNIFSKRCINLIIKNYDGFYDNILSGLQGSVIVCGSSWYNLFSGRNIMIFNTSHLKGNIFLSSHVYAIKLHGTSFLQNVFYPCSYNINIFNGGYFLANNIYLYSNTINIDTFNWIDKLNIRGSEGLTLLTTGKTYKLYNVDIMAGDYNSNKISITNGDDLKSLKVALKSNGKIVIYNEADLIADQN